jgi:CheY-like chemotaxis protein
MAFKKLILVVEDDEGLRENVVSILEREGYSVIQAENGQVALDLLKSSKFTQLPCGMIWHRSPYS